MASSASSTREIATPRPSYKRAAALIEALNKEHAPHILKGLVVVMLITEANAMDASAERHRSGGHD
jgi:hypothetical protein